MIIETQITHNGTKFRHRLYLSELELSRLKPNARPEIIKATKRICAAACAQKWLRHVLENKNQ